MSADDGVCADDVIKRVQRAAARFNKTEEKLLRIIQQMQDVGCADVTTLEPEPLRQRLLDMFPDCTGRHAWTNHLVDERGCRHDEMYIFASEEKRLEHHALSQYEIERQGAARIANMSGVVEAIRNIRGATNECHAADDDNEKSYEVGGDNDDDDDDGDVTLAAPLNSVAAEAPTTSQNDEAQQPAKKKVKLSSE